MLSWQLLCEMVECIINTRYTVAPLCSHLMYYFLIGLWNQVFLGSNGCLFILIPFAYFFSEAEGFAGSKKVNLYSVD